MCICNLLGLSERIRWRTGFTLKDDTCRIIVTISDYILIGDESGRQIQRTRVKRYYVIVTAQNGFWMLVESHWLLKVVTCGLVSDHFSFRRCARIHHCKPHAPDLTLACPSLCIFYTWCLQCTKSCVRSLSKEISCWLKQIKQGSKWHQSTRACERRKWKFKNTNTYTVKNVKQWFI